MAFFTPTVLSEIIRQLVLNYFPLTSEVIVLSEIKILLFPILRLTLYNYFALLPSLIVLFRVYVCVYVL